MLLSKKMLLSKLVAVLALACPLFAETLPNGTALPIQLSTGLNARKDRAGKQLSGRVMQDVALPAGEKIKSGSRVLGHILQITKRGPAGFGVVVRFDSIQDGERTIPVVAAVLAVATSAGVHEAQIPINSSANIEPTTQWVTRQVGGDIVNRRLRKVASEDVVGRWVGENSVLMKLTPNPEAGCPGGPGYDREQALWIFSSTACGVYELTRPSHIRIVRSGLTSPLGEVELNSEKDLSLGAGSGWLLMSLSSK